MADSARPAQRFDALDGMRALACYAVMATHVGFETARSFGTSPLAPWLARLDASVPIFLMLSGFLLYRPFVVRALRGQQPSSVVDFYWRRAVRVLPACWLTTIVTLGVLSTRSASPRDWLAYLSLTQIYNKHDLDPSLSHLWTLVVEVSFYAVLPVIALSLRGRIRSADSILRRQCALLAGLFLACIGWQALAFQVPALGLTATSWLPGTIDWFALGMFLAVLSAMPAECTALPRLRSVLSQWAGSPGLCWTLALGLFWFVTLPLGGPLDLAEPTAWQHISKNVIEGVLVFFMMLPLTLGRPGLIWQVLGNRVARFLGEISYGVYLWHLPMLILLQREFKLPIFQGHYWEFFLLTAVSATMLGTLSWYLFERPLLRRFSRPSWRSQPEPAASKQIPITHSA
ncbi:MAG: acyltransferase [Actinomycetota bacterium]|nr:acyltransferase [Actinomycetota bacterium]MDQ2959391.1 acyltransferase [Actinomycetota bacterium]